MWLHRTHSRILSRESRTRHLQRSRHTHPQFRHSLAEGSSFSSHSLMHASPQLLNVLCTHCAHSIALRTPEPPGCCSHNSVSGAPMLNWIYTPGWTQSAVHQKGFGRRIGVEELTAFQRMAQQEKPPKHAQTAARGRNYPSTSMAPTTRLFRV